MDGDTLYSIGELARRTGLTVKTIRFYSDRGIVKPTERSRAGYRLYDTDTVARLAFVRTLRELGLDLPTIRKVVDRELSLPDVAAAHADALAVQIGVLRLRCAVLTAVAERGSTPEETELMHQLAQLSEDERQRLIGDSMTPELPDDPEPEQVQAWVELAELSLDPDFRAGFRRIVEDQVAEQSHDGVPAPRRDTVAVTRDQVGPALAVGIEPASPEADPIVSAFTAHYARTLCRPDDTELRHRLLTRLERVNDPRRERYLRLLAVVNRWPAPESLAPAFDWSVEALRVRAQR
ncbi:MerR family transcriptional regulator [Amycolatopsis azurea]|uniref:MerR family transcriptional regulator n=1 Tax=Amycolatopsis azurea TaxID=36819 RepID=UPI0038008173